jgi:methylmalonyl-CoA mutase
MYQEDPSILPIASLYTEDDLKKRGISPLPPPGTSPYTRGPYGSMYTKKPWTIRQYAGFSSPEESNAFYRAALAAGQKGLSIAFDLATHRGYDSDHPRVIGDVGKAGVAIDSVEDMKVLFQGIPLGEMSVSMTMNGAVLPVLASYIVAAEEQGVDQKDLTGTIQNDILKEYMVRNTYIYPPEPSLRIVGDIIAYTAQHMPSYHPISISGYHMQEAGAPPALELAYTLADGLEYVKIALSRGLKIDDFAPRLSFFFGIGMDFLSEIAKLRAARTLWAELLKPFGPQDPKSSILKTHCQTSGYTLTVQDPINNVIRTTIEALAAVLGGTQSLHTNAFDEAIALPSDQSARIARNTQLILQLETDILRTADPFGGSYAMESLTWDIMEKAKTLIHEVQTQEGGMIQAIQSGLAKRRIEEASLKKQAQIDRGELKILGVNAYKTQDEPEIPVRKIDHRGIWEGQMARLKELKARRQEPRVRGALEVLKDGARDPSVNLLPLTIEAVRARATLGEISQALEDVFGRYEGVMTAGKNLYGQKLKGDPEFDLAQARVKDFEKGTGRRPRILVVKLGQDGHDRGIKIIATGLSDCGFDVDIGPLFQTPEEAAKQAIETDVHGIGVSSQAGAHLVLIPALKKALEGYGAKGILLVVGGVIPREDERILKDEMGVDLVFGPGTRVATCALGILDRLQSRLSSVKT